MERDRLGELEKLLDEFQADALVLSRPSDVRWASGFTGSNCLMVVRRASAHLLTDGRYTTQAASEVDGAQIHIARETLEGRARDLNLLDGARVILYQSDDLTCHRFDKLREVSPDASWRGYADLLAPLVAVKSTAEIDAIKRAQSITEATFEHIITLVRPGLSERALAAEIVYDQLKRGAERMSFEPIVAAGPNGALPHARPTTRELQKGDVLVLDFGCVVDGYASDMTRTVAIGEPPEDARDAHAVVLEAQQTAISAARPGMRAPDLDRIARNVVEEAGLGQYFTHGLGHGVGLQTHEWPRVSYSSDHVLPENAVVTIEPGIYVPGRFGIRIEDLIVLRRDGAEVLTTTSHELRCL